MSYAENHQKFVLILNRRHPSPRLFNAACHASAGLAAEVGAQGEMLSYVNDDAGFSATISRYPFIILTAKNSGQLAKLRDAAATAGVTHNVFVTAMIGPSAEAQLEATRGAAAADLDYVALALFGNVAAVDPLTRRFSLLREAQAEQGVPDAGPD